MSEVERICPECGAANALDVHFCGACAAPLSSRALARRERALPAKFEPKNAALAVGATGVAAVALRVGTLLVKQVAKTLLDRRNTTESTALAEQEREGRPVMRIKRSWAIGDSTGVRHWGSEDITIYDE